MSERYTETASAETARSDVAATSLPFTAGENGSYTRFIQCYLEDKERLDQYLFPLVNIGARNNVNIADKEFLEGRIKIPKTVEEQTKIVDMFEDINHLITLHQRESIFAFILKNITHINVTNPIKVYFYRRCFTCKVRMSMLLILIIFIYALKKFYKTVE